MRTAVVAPGIHDRWDDAHLVGRRIAGALAHHGRVTVLVPGSSSTSWSEGLFDVHQHEAVPSNPHRAFMLEQALYGPWQARTAGPVPPTLRRLEEELFLARGEYAPGLIDQLRKERFDLVVLAGATSGHAVFASRVLSEGAATFLAPVPRDRRSLRLGLVRDTIDRSLGLLVTTDTELRDVEDAIGHDHPTPRRHIGFVSRTNELAAQALPSAFPDVPTVVVAADWTKIRDHRVWSRWADLLSTDLAGRAEVRAIGPAANRLPPPFAGESGSSRIDLWRWTSHALAVIDPQPYSVLSVPSVEAMTYGVPLLAPADSGGARALAETGDSGLWFRTYEELRGGIELLADEPDVRTALGANGRAFAEDRFGDTEMFVKAVLHAVQLD
jgi:hypothetical protein